MRVSQSLAIPATLGTLLGQRRVVEILSAAVASGKAHHAYLFEGPSGCGKVTAARALAAALNCEARDVLGCGRCEACRKIAADLHPDVIFFDMTPKGLTECVRELLLLGGFRPHEGRARVIVLDPAEALAGPQDRAEPANVLLKTLEEPPADTHFVLTTAEPRRLPITVRSRCQRLRFLPLSDEVVAGWLERERGLAPDEARAVADRAGGSLGRALGELDSEGDGAAAVLAEALLRAAERARPRDVFGNGAELGADREVAEAACQVLWLGLRDALLIAEGLSMRVPPLRAERARTRFGARAPVEILSALHRADECALALRGNVAPSLALEHLALELWPSARSGA